MKTDPKNESGNSRELIALNAWYELPFGRFLRQKISAKLDQVLSKVPAHELLHLGVSGFEETLAGRQRERMIFFTDIACEHLLSKDDNVLPLKAETQDCVVLLHALDIATNPHAVLREVCRINAKGGYVVIAGFNSFSLWGAYRSGVRFSRWGKQVPWNVNFYSLGRLRDWLSLLGYEVGITQTLNYQPIIHRDAIREKVDAVNSLGSLLLPWCGNVYVIVAQKCTIPLTPVKLRWKLQYQPIKPVKPGLAGPVGLISHEKETG